MPDHETPAPALLFEHQFCFPLYSAANAMVRAYRPELEPLGLTYLQYMVMLILWEQDGVSVGELGEKLHLDSGTLTPLLKRLESKSLLRRRINDQDERMKCLELTPEGRALRKQAEQIPEKVLCRVNMNMTQLQALKQQCESLIAQLEHAPPSER